MMKMVFFLNEYRPFGGLPRDCLRLAVEAATRGHEITILTRGWQGELPAQQGVNVVQLGFLVRTNAAKDRLFIRQAQAWRKSHPHDLAVGFLRMPGLDVYFAADPCFEAKVRRLKPRWFRWTPRYRRFALAEKSVFQKGAQTQVLLLHPGEVETYRQLYGTEDSRLHVLPPGIRRPHWAPADREAARRLIREERGLPPDASLVLLAGSGFRTKGLDRALRATAPLESAHLAVAGQDKPDPFLPLVRQLGLTSRVHFLGGRSDLDRWMLAADVLLHPAYSENTGTVIVEALVHGLPVIATAVCGFAAHVTASKGGIVLEEPFRQAALDEALRELIENPRRLEMMRRAGSHYGSSQDLYSCHRRAVDYLESLAPTTQFQDGNATSHTGKTATPAP